MALSLQLGVTSTAMAGDRAGRVRAALTTLDNWLATSPYGHVWSDYLLTDALQAELANGDRANSTVVADILAQYESDADGLQRWRFVAVRDALRNWADDLALQSVENLAATIRSTPTTIIYSDQQVNRAQARARQAISALDRFLSQSPARASGWKDYLQWDVIQDQLAAPKPDVRERIGIVKRLSAAEDGLGLPEFKRAREALTAYFDRQQIAAMKPEKVQEELQEKLGELAEFIADLDAQATQRESTKVGRHLTFIDRYANAPSVGRLIRRRYSHPNLVGYASGQMLSSAVNRALHEPAPVNNTIMGTRVRGHGITTGQVRLDLLSDPQRGSFRITMEGVNNAQTTGSVRKVSIHSNSATQLRANTNVYFTPDTGMTADQIQAWARTNSDVFNITTSSRAQRLVQRIAWKKVGQQKPQAERIGSQMATTQLRSQFGQQVSQMVSDANQTYHSKLRKPLVRQDLYPDLFNVSTDPTAIRLFARKAYENQLAAPTAATPPPAGHDAAATIHESLINNIAAHLLGGKTLSNKDAEKAADSEQAKNLKKMVEVTNVGEPPEDKKDAPWQVTLASSNPVSIEFRNNKIRFTVRGTEFIGVDEETVYKRNMNIWGSLGIAFDQNGGLLLMLEDWDVEPTAVEINREKGKEGGFKPADAPLRSKLRVRLTDLLGKPGADKQVTVKVKPIEPQGEAARLGKLVYSLCQPNGAWLTLALDRSHRMTARPVRPSTAMVQPTSAPAN